MVNLNKTARTSITLIIAFIIIYTSFQAVRIFYFKAKDNADSVVYDTQWESKKREEISALIKQEDATQDAIAALTSQMKSRFISREEDRMQFNSLTQQYIDLVKKRTEAESALRLYKKN